MSDTLVVVIALVVFIGGLYWLRRSARRTQLSYIESYRFPPAIRQKLRQKHPHLSEDELQLVFRGLRDYFHICHMGKKKMVAMPSQVVDDAWHEFILFTRKYESFCKKALGRFVHHTPVEAMPSPTMATEGIKRAWKLACEKEGISPCEPIALPLLFGIDAQLNIENGFHYSLDCSKDGSRYCAGHIGCGSGCGGDSMVDGLGDSGGSSCGSGCGGD